MVFIKIRALLLLLFVTSNFFLDLNSAIKKRSHKKRGHKKKSARKRKRGSGGADFLPPRQVAQQAQVIFNNPTDNALLINPQTVINNINDKNIFNFIKNSLLERDFRKQYDPINGKETILTVKDINQIEFLREAKINSQNIFYRSMFDYSKDVNGNDDIQNPFELGHATNAFFTVFFLHWLNYVKYQKSFNGFLDLISPMRNFLVENRLGYKYHRLHFAFYYRPLSLVKGNYQVTNRDQIQTMVDRIIYLEQYFDFYSTVLFQGMYEGEGSHYYSFCVDHHHKTIFLINPLRQNDGDQTDYTNSDLDLEFLEALFAEINKITNRYKNYTLKPLSIPFQHMTTACGIAAATMSYVFSFGGLRALRQFFYGYGQGFFMDIDQVLLLNLEKIVNTAYISPRQARAIYGHDFEMSVCNKMYKILTYKNTLDDLLVDFK